MTGFSAITAAATNVIDLHNVYMTAKLPFSGAMDTSGALYEYQLLHY